MLTYITPIYKMATINSQLLNKNIYQSQNEEKCVDKKC